MSPSPLTPSPVEPPRRIRRALLARFRKDRRGVTAIEFGLVAMPFFGIIFAILEVALTFWITQVLETMVAEAARQVYTGQFQQANRDKTPAEMRDAFKDLICGTGVDAQGRKINRVALFDCHGKLEVDVRPAGTFQGSVTNPIVGGNFNTSGWGYQDSAASQIVIVRAAFVHPVFVSVMDMNAGNINNRSGRLILATAAFRNEPFQ
jgi:Flp pilus assembly protein TadG